MTDFMKRVRCEQDAFLRDFYKGITLLVIGIVKSRKNTSIAKYITLRISVTRCDVAFYNWFADFSENGALHVAYAISRRRFLFVAKIIKPQGEQNESKKITR